MPTIYVAISGLLALALFVVAIVVGGARLERLAEPADAEEYRQ